MTTLDQELKQQLLWKPTNQIIENASLNLIQGEFLDRENIHKKSIRTLVALLNYSRQNIPFYRELFRNKYPTITSTEIVTHFNDFPILNKQTFNNNREKFNSENLPKGQTIHSLRQSSGTTGLPIKIYHTNLSNFNFRLAKQREYRWFRYNPSSKMAIIRNSDLLSKADHLSASHQNGWPLIGHMYSTGPSFNYSVFNEIKDQLKWLTETNPTYLLTYAGNLEHLALQQHTKYTGDQLKSTQVISDMLTHTMIKRIKRSFNVPIQINYGLSELGLIASKCPEGQRYHVHDEHFYLEIINQKGQACQPGEIGKVIVTDLSNHVMPLIRYDTDDLAIATDQNCPCGRQLYCFGEIHGRYSRIGLLPEGIYKRYSILRDILITLPHHLDKYIEKYQVYHSKKNSFELRVQGQNTPPDFDETIYKKWQELLGNDILNLEIKHVQQLKVSSSGKFQDFISEYSPYS